MRPIPRPGLYKYRYKLACWLVGFDIYASGEVSYRQGYRRGVNDTLTKKEQ